MRLPVGSVRPRSNQNVPLRALSQIEGTSLFALKGSKLEFSVISDRRKVVHVEYGRVDLRYSTHFQRFPHARLEI